MLPVNFDTDIVAIKNEIISTVLLSPDSNFADDYLVDYERGGVDISNSSQGLQVKDWTLEYDTETGDINVSAVGSVTTTIFNYANVTQLSLAFDQNMNPFVAFYVNDTDAKFRWYDPTVPGFVITDLPAGSENPRASMDDKRIDSSSTSDIILAYTRGGDLYARMQRDRYDIEYLLYTVGAGVKLGKIGTSKGGRLAFGFLKPIDL